ncbi:MAG: CopG family transcriptional regulator [Desulfuromonadales bacterium]|nr:MAG: CopG family transcriptional regulator [Desulfuromonadales bacterium]
MGKQVCVNPRPTVISVRITDEQMEAVRRLMEARNVSASDIMREALCLFADNLERAERLNAIRAAARKYARARGES